MGRYVLRRALAAILVVWFVSIIVFLMMRALPGDTLLVKLGEGGNVRPERMAALRHEMGLDQSLPSQYVTWVSSVFDGSFGHSLIYEEKSVSSRIREALPVTTMFGLAAMATAIAIAVPLGVISAVTRDTGADYVIRVFSLAGISFPQFWVGIVVIIYGTLYFGYVPPGRFVPLWSHPLVYMRNMWIPTLVLGFALTGYALRLIRSTMLEALNQDYVRTARAKGLGEVTILRRHVLRNAMIPVLTLIGNQSAFVFSGALILEILFNFPGMGSLTYQAIQQRDYTQIQGNVLMTASLIVAINLLVDLSYGMIDPRVRYE